ncbi:MAG: thioredoxin family protein, partial [Thermoguttaceae bacterium]
MVSLHATLVFLALSGTGQTELLDFYSDGCAPCRRMDPTVRELAALGYPVRRVNVTKERALAAQFGVQDIPCFVMVVDGREVDRQVGATSLGRLEQMASLG